MSRIAGLDRGRTQAHAARMGSRRSLLLIILGVFALASCGEKAQGPVAEEPVPAPATAPTPTVDDPGAAVVATASTAPLSTGPSSSIPDPSSVAFELVSERGAVRGLVPREAGPDPIESTYGSTLPRFVPAQQRWVVEDICRLAVVVQDVAPLYPEEDIVDSFDAAGLAWTTYNVGALDGSVVVAVATAGGVSVSVGGQAMVSDDAHAASMRTVVRSVAESITFADGRTSA